MYEAALLHGNKRQVETKQNTVGHVIQTPAHASAETEVMSLPNSPRTQVQRTLRSVGNITMNLLPEITALMSSTHEELQRITEEQNRLLVMLKRN